jgi:hypothetical protein
MFKRKNKQRKNRGKEINRYKNYFKILKTLIMIKLCRFMKNKVYKQRILLRKIKEDLGDLKRKQKLKKINKKINNKQNKKKQQAYN